MNLSAVGLVEQVARYADLLDAVGGADRFADASSNAPIRLAADAELVRGLAVVSRLARLVEAERVKLAGEIGRRSTGDEETSLARRAVGAADLVAQVAGIRDDHAGSIVEVHIGLHELLTGIGAATISGVEGTISAATARKLACEAQIIPVVLGGESQPLDVGVGRRFFTEAQRRAMAARDQGCAGPGCDAPLCPGPKPPTSDPPGGDPPASTTALVASPSPRAAGPRLRPAPAGI